MVYIKEKKVNGGKYYYLSKSFRLPNGKVSSIEKMVKNKDKPLEEIEKENLDFFIKKEKEAFANYALTTYPSGAAFSKEQIRKIEEIKVDYSYTIKKFTKNQWKDVFDRFIANFTYESNAIEGNTLTLKDVAIVMFEKRTIEGKDLREIYETRNSREVMNLLLKQKFGVNEKEIIKMNEILMKDIDVATGYKKLPNYFPGSNVELTPPEKVEEEMNKLIAGHEKNVKKMHPLQVSALFHGKFEKIHPFEDGNGRVGRFLSNVILLNNGYPPLIIRKTQRDAYIKCLNDFHKGYTPNLERFFLGKYKDTYRKFFEVYLKYIKR